MVPKVWIVLWKDLLMRRNHYIATTLEVVIPIVIIIFANITLPKYEPEISNDPISFEEFKDDHCVYRHSHYGNIVYDPSTPFTDSLMLKAACYAGYKKSFVKPGKLSDNSSYFRIGVKFEDVNNKLIPDFLNYTLYPTNKVWVNLLTLWRYSGAAIPRYSIPSLYDVIELQRAIDVSFMDMKKVPAVKLNLENTDFFGRSPRLFSIAISLALFLAFCLMIPPIISRIVQEKYTGAKELMLMMGIVRWQLWVAKFLDVILLVIITVTGMVVFLYSPLKEESNTLRIPALVFWGVIMYGLIGVIFFLFFLSCFFEKATIAVYVTQFILTFSFVFNNVIFDLIQLPRFVKYLMCFFPQVALMNAASVLLDFDFYGKTVKLSERLSGKDDYLTLSNILSIMSINIIIYSVLTWYLEQVKPGKFGVPLPLNFFLNKSYWSPVKVDISSNNACLSQKVPDSVEPVPSNLKVGVSIQNLCKVYKSLDKGPVTAVDNVNIDFYQSEISALLGHNGAGKTTVFSIITGLTYPTSGKIVINGYDLGLNISEARNSLGLCPQQDMFFNDLTTEQTLKFYGVVKGLTLNEAKKEGSVLIKKLKLENVRHTQANNLSGGQKRKVSLAIALIGGSEVLVLDEPTSGMDPEIRREIWEILLGFRGTRTILLTTHFMEEADALCDRIAIMDHGRIQCYGSPMFLKSRYGKGYVLSVVIVDTEQARELTEYIKRFIPSAKLKSQNIRTLSYELPESEIEAFPALLSGLDEKQNKNEIASYGINLASLEDVFLRLRNDNEIFEHFDSIDSSPFKKLDMEENVTNSKIIGCFLYLYQFWALMIKKWILLRRGYKSFLLYVILPAVLVILTESLSHKKLQPNPIANLSSSKPLTYTTDLYSPFFVLYTNNDKSFTSLTFESFIANLDLFVMEVPNITEVVLNVFKEDFYKYAKQINLAVEFFPREIFIRHNDDAVHMVPIALNLIHNFLLKSAGVTGIITTSISPRFANKDIYIPPRQTPKCRIDNLPDFSGGQTMFYLLGPVKENFYGAKEIQLMVTPTPIYWLSHLLFDIVSFAVYIFFVCLGVELSQHDEFILEHIDEVVLSLLLWGAGLILIAYFISTLTKNIAAASFINLTIYIVFCFIIYNVIAFDGLPKFFQYLHPSCIIKFGYTDLCAGKKNNYVWALFVYDAFLFGLLVVKDSELLSLVLHRLINGCAPINYSLEDVKDTFVKKEEEVVKEIIKKNKGSETVLIVDELKRWYFKNFRPSPAVRGISFIVNRGECFGLLGVNGAGKTSTFRMLTGALPSSHGSTYVCSTQLSPLTRQKYLLLIGYCPQFGGLIPVLKGQELLKLFAQLRGIRRSHINEEVDKWLKKFNLHEFAKQKCGTYSGGNQRKLSTALSLIGDCPLIFLDEPTSGVDPLSRRLIWNVIGDVQKEGQSVVLTSHSMDECEALCSRLAIMVNGRFRCIGETTTLKDRFGQGYCVQLKITNGASEEIVDSLKKSVVRSFEPGCELVDEHLTILQYHVTNRSITWAQLFAELKVLKENFHILESYTATATTLEQIFIYFARETNNGMEF